MRLIDADAFFNEFPELAIEPYINAPTVELTETEIQEVLDKRCMTAVANEYLVALHGKPERPQGEWIEFENEKRCYCSNCHSAKEQMIPDFCSNCGADMKGGAE